MSNASLSSSIAANWVTPSAAKAPATSSNALTANLAGTVVKVLVEEGQKVSSGETLLVLGAAGGVGAAFGLALGCALVVHLVARPGEISAPGHRRSG